MRFPGHETVSIGNCVRVYAALNKVIIISILLSLFMTTADNFQGLALEISLKST